MMNPLTQWKQCKRKFLILSCLAKQYLLLFINVHSQAMSHSATQVLSLKNKHV